MTGKEALEELKNGLFGHCKSSYLKDDLTELEKVLKVYQQCYEIVKKDLEVLEAHKKIEEELGIDLITLFEALKNGIFTYKEYIPAEDLVIWKGQLYHKPMMSAFNIDLFMFDDYGTKWALAKEELER